MLFLERKRFTKKEGAAVKFSKRGKILLAIILVVGGIGGLVLNSITGHGASNRSFYHSDCGGLIDLCGISRLGKITADNKD